MLEWIKQRIEALTARAPVLPDPPGVNVPAWLVAAAKFAANVAMITLVYFLLLYTLDIARDRAGAMQVTHAGMWVGEIAFYFPYVVGFALVAFGVPYVAKIALPAFMSLSWRAQPWAKGWALFIAMAVSAVVIAGTFTVQGDTLMERDRGAAVAVEQVAQEAAVLAARIADKRAELDDMVSNASAYVRTAASMSPEAYDVFLAQRRDDWQYDRLVSYRATAVDAQRLRTEIAALRDQQARQTVAASVQAEVTTDRTEWVAGLLGWLEGARALLLSFVIDIVALLMPWIALRLEQTRNMELAMAGIAWADESRRIADHRAEAPPATQPMEPMKEEVFDADTGEMLVHRRATWARKPRRKGKPEQVMVPAEAERGPQNMQTVTDADGSVTEIEPGFDGDGRSIEPAAPEQHQAGDTQPEQDESHGDADEIIHADTSSEELSDEEATALLAEIEAAEGRTEQYDLPNGEGVMLSDDSEPNPDRLIAAE